MTDYPPSLPPGATPPEAASDASLTAHVARFARRLRDRGMDLSSGDQADAVRALQLVDIGDVDEVFLALRTALKIDRRHWKIFSLMFDSMWRRPESAATSFGPRPDDREAGQAAFGIRRAAPAPVGDGDTKWIDRDNAAGYSPDAQLRHKTFDECTTDDLAAMQRLLERLARRLATCCSRRRVPSRRGDLVDLRRSFRRSLAAGGDMVELAKRARAVERPHLVLLCDTSGSMDAYSRFLLMFALALKRVAPRTEAFAFNTRLTRITRWLSPSNVTATLEGLASGVEDWSGGTRIGACLWEFADSWLTQMVHADTTVIILSDGLDRGDTDLLEEALVRLRRRARSIIWLNPLMGDDRYRPEAKGMKAALPYVDRLLPAHNLAALEAVLPL
ncbi:MAG: VWA domain-containing protein [Acidobacteria bacterium]|nr:VWA domain-containing protein [Acidobacteriota bacterium]